MSLSLLFRSAAIGGAAFALFCCLSPAGRALPARRQATLALAALLALAGLAWNARTLYANFAQPHEWDFLAYYLDGKVAVAGLNFYEKEHYARELSQLSLPYEIDSEFTETKLGVGFHYLPPTILLHYPLGFFEYDGAHALWVIFWVLVAAGNGALLYRIFLRGRGAEGVLAAAALYLFFPSLRYSLQFEQTSIMLLLPCLLFWQDRERDRAGVWAALALAIKPMGAFLGLYLLLRGRWRALGLSALVFALLSGLVAALVNPAAVLAGFSPGRFAHVPEFQYSEYVNQSLLGEIIRRVGPSPWGGPPTHPVFLALGALIFAAGAWTLARLPRRREQLAVALLLPLALLVYPGTLNHYSLLILPVLFWIGLGGLCGRWTGCALAGVVYALMPLNLCAWAHLLLLGALLAEARREPRDHATP